MKKRFISLAVLLSLLFTIAWASSNTTMIENTIKPYSGIEITNYISLSD